MKRYRITSMRRGMNYKGNLTFEGFLLEEENGTPVVGYVNPFPDMDIMLDSTEQQYEIAESMVGKYIVCENLIYTATYTQGHTYVEE